MNANKKAAGVLRAVALIVVLGVATGCGEDFHLSVSNLEIGPDPAGPGDMVQATFLASMLPPQSHAVYVFIDGAEHTSLSFDEGPAIPVVLQLGDAADLIDAYGSGAHAAYVEVRVDGSGRSARSASVAFELEDPTP
jgi:hypothetical protein